MVSPIGGEPAESMVSPQTGKRGPLPPVFFLGGLLLQWGLHVFLPITRLVPEAWAAWGAVPIVLGIGVIVFADRHFKKVSTAINPFDRPSFLVTSGVFRRSRNPIYLAMIVVLFGAAFAWGTLSTFVLPPALAWLLSRKFILMEEATLSQTFGQDYDRYKGRVRRWL